jgi:5-methylcytosine-specific restriction endonuclease McrA
MIDAATRQMVRVRAGGQCEYCELPQEIVPLATFHVEHVIPRQHGGSDDPSNLALACYHCNLHKGTNLAGVDPDTGWIEPLFNPRTQHWDDHFEMRGMWIMGRTPCGRTTVRVLAMNADEPVELREEYL